MVSGDKLQKKWKGLRDSFVREMKKNKNKPSGSGASSKNSYIYFNRLMFIERSVRNKITDSNMKKSDVPSDAEQDFSGDGEDVMRPPSSQPKKKKISAADAEFISIIKKNIGSASKNQPQTISTTESDDDKLFCLSLHKELQKIPEVNRLKVKIEIMNVIQKGQQLHHHIPSTYPEYMTQHGYTQYNTRNQQPRHPTAPFQDFTATTQRQQYFSDNLQYNPESPSISNQRGYNTSTYAQSPSPASTVGSQESDCLALFQDD